MNDLIPIIIVASIIGVLLGHLIRWLATRFGKIRPAEAQANDRLQAAGIPKKPSLLPQLVGSRQSVATLVLLILLMSVGVVMIGLTAGVFSQLIPIVFLYPVVMAINSGKMIVEVLERLKIRKLSQLLLLSLFSAIAMYGTYHYCRYLGFQLQASVEIFEGFSEAIEAENFAVTQAFLDYALEEETGHSGFLGYILYEAREGVSIGRLTRSSSFNLGPVLTWLYWLLEFGIILGVTIQKGKGLIGRSFCESCGNWYGSERHLGGTASANQSTLLGLIQQKDFSGLRGLIEQNAELPSLELYFQGCQVCGKSSSQLVVRHAFQNAKGSLQFTDAAQKSLQPNESVLLLNQLSFSGD